MKKLLVLLNTLSLLLLGGCSAPDAAVAEGEKIPVRFALEEAATRAAGGSLAADSTVRVIAYLRTPGQTGYPEGNRRDECTYKVTASGLVRCAVRPDGSADPAGTLPLDMALGAGSYDFYAITPAIPVYHHTDNPVVRVSHGTDFASSITGPVTVSLTDRNVTLAALDRKCARLSFKTERSSTASDITKIRVQKLTLEEMSDEPLWATGTSALAAPGANLYSATIRLDKTVFSVPGGNADYQQTAATTCLPFPLRNFRIRVEALFNDETLPYVLETTVEKTAFAAGSNTNLTLYLSRKKVKVVLEQWTVADKPDDTFGKE